ncbi:NAD(P)-binding Rossmann-fold containing protein [Glarea lozoyensis ATCC 20868]|uniref:NAD(P)-binding Rossmann-fold containing protein n=1 Tax=Glarea lozoyensis (strain ATCC 20868 / MF5171) TaxID=1116229 RepID=S3DJD0_GLAL2|nr:NAD(P)-binding Rossmann-fold containing protein [Glarea lozoyensis ATCC 20868]EPE26663.1 NAD(P)-binding Rossmann-fold containing protein [Glarea lozoyensis ATCC 20868]
MAPWSLVTPASRGIGFHLTRHLLRTTPLAVVATARKDPRGLKKELLNDLKDVDEKRLTILELDVTDENTVQTAAEEAKKIHPVNDHHLHLAFCIPGILYPEKSPSQLQHDELTKTFAVNTIGPMLIAKHFSPFLPRKSSQTPLISSSDSWLPQHAVWLNMSARVGSTTDNALGGWYSYRASKAAVNSLTKSFDIFVKGKSGDNAMAMSYHPGTVKTGLSKEFWGKVAKEKLFEPKFAIERMCHVVGSVGLAGRGRCWDWKGTEVPP